MRRIHKDGPTPEYLIFLKSRPNKWDDFHDIQRFPGLSGRTREHILVYEQDCLSGYTEMPLDTDSETHIDHYKKKGMPAFKHLMFEWNNFIVDSRDSQYGACYKDDIVNSVDYYNQIFNPVDEDVENYFRYNGDGSIIPKYSLSEVDSQKVIKTVEIFNLNHKSLKTRRAELIKIIDAYDLLSDDEIRNALEGFGFKSVVEQKLNERNLLQE